MNPSVRTQNMACSRSFGLWLARIRYAARDCFGPVQVSCCRLPWYSSVLDVEMEPDSLLGESCSGVKLKRTSNFITCFLQMNWGTYLIANLISAPAHSPQTRSFTPPCALNRVSSQPRTCWSTRSARWRSLTRNGWKSMRRRNPLEGFTSSD